MTLSDWSQCPSCKLCANYSDIKRVLEHEPVCPMCEQQVQPMMVKISDDASRDFKALVALMKDPNGEDEAGEMDSDEGADMLG